MAKRSILNSNLHRSKGLRSLYKTSFNQAAKRKKRQLARNEKGVNGKKNAFNSSRMLRSIVHCPTKMHCFKIRIGRGFSVEEIKNYYSNINIASSCGLIVDKRRRKSGINQFSNIHRVKTYKDLHENSQTKKSDNLDDFSSQNIIKADSGNYENSFSSDFSKIYKRTDSRNLRSFLYMKELRRK